MNPIHPSNNKLSNAAKLRALAYRINNDNHLNASALTLIASITATWVLFAAPHDKPEGSKIGPYGSISNFHRYPGSNQFFLFDEAKGKTYITLRPQAEIPAEYKHIERSFRRMTESLSGQTMGILRKIQTDGDTPYVVVTLKGKDHYFFDLAIPKAMIEEKRTDPKVPSCWETLEKATPVKHAVWNSYEKLGPPEKRSPKQALPLERTLTSKDGRTLDVTIRSIRQGVVNVTRKGDTKLTPIQFGLLSEEDQKFLKESVDAGSKKILVISNSSKALEDAPLDTEGYSLTVATLVNDPYAKILYDNVVEIPSLAVTDELKKLVSEHDAVWIRTPDKNLAEFMGLLETIRKPAAIYWFRKVKATKDFLAEMNKPAAELDKGIDEEERNQKEFVQVSGNFVFFRDISRGENNDGSPASYSINDPITREALAGLKGLIREP